MQSLRKTDFVTESEQACELVSGNERMIAFDQRVGYGMSGIGSALVPHCLGILMAPQGRFMECQFKALRNAQHFGYADTRVLQRLQRSR